MARDGDRRLVVRNLRHDRLAAADVRGVVGGLHHVGPHRVHAQRAPLAREAQHHLPLEPHGSRAWPRARRRAAAASQGPHGVV